MGSMNIDGSELSPSNGSPLRPDEFRRQGHLIIDFLADYYQNVGNFPVLSQVEPGYLRKRLPRSAPYSPEPIDSILKDIEEHIIPGITHWQSPNYFAYFPSSGSVAGFLGEVLSTGFNVVGFNWMSSPAATELENIVIDWFGEMLKLPKSFLFSGTGGGVLQGTTCEAILCCVTAARDQILRRVGEEMYDKLVVYGSDQTHCALQKAAQIAGIRTGNFRVIKTTKSTWYGLLPESLRAAMEADRKAGLIPFFLCATVGTTSTNAVDPISPLCDVAKDYDVWVHVDAAYAGSACICPEFRQLIDGVEKADSFSLNAHKWFFTTLDCCCLWVKKPSALIESLSTDPEYLKNKSSDSKQVVDYKNWQITLSRRFRALKLWMVIRHYGIANLCNFLRSHVNMAKLFEDLVRSDARVEVPVPRFFAMVCFRVSSKAIIPLEKREIKQTSTQEERANELTKTLFDSLNASGQLFVTHAKVDGMYMIRFAVGAALTQEEHVVAAWNVMKEHLDRILDLEGGENVS